VAARRSPVRERIARLVAAEDVVLTSASSAREVLADREALGCDVLLLGATTADQDPVEIVETASALADHPDVVCLSDAPDRNGEAELLRAGAASVLPLSLEDDVLAARLTALFGRSRAARTREPTSPRATPEPPPPRSEIMAELLALADRVALGDAAVLLYGETGAGKEWVAKRIHASSRRSEGPFVPVNCAAIAEGLIESELFGHVKGAFTGAVRSKRGHFELAHGGTLFLDEISDMSPGVQVKLLRVLEDHAVQPVGSEKSIPVDVRVVAATNRPLDDAVERGAFRQDLYYRLAVITLSLPALRERPEDIPELARVYARHFARQLGRPEPAISEEAMEALASHSWPGNVRELINVVERAVLLSSGPELGLPDLPVALLSAPPTGRELADLAARASLPGAPIGYAEARAEALAEFDRRFLSALLSAAGGRVGLAAKRAGLNPRTLYAKMRALGMRKEDFRE